MSIDICLVDIDGTIAEIPAEAYFVNPIDPEKCNGCENLKVEIERKPVKFSISSLWKSYLEGKDKKYFCHRPSWCVNKDLNKIKKIFSSENVMNFKPIAEVRNIIWQLVRSNFGVAYVSGRPNDLILSTSKWLGLAGFPWGLVACVGKDGENPIDGKMRIAETVIKSNEPQIIVAFEDCQETMSEYKKRFQAVDGLKMISNPKRLLQRRKELL